MVDRSYGTKQSNFTAVTSMPSASSIGVFVAGANYQISYANFLTGLGVTGTLEQVGAPLATPVLDIAGTVNGIRSITGGAGIVSSVNAQNGIDITHNFTQDSTGASLLHDISAASPTFVSLVPGAGIGLAVSGDTITVTATGTALPATKAVAVNVASDFPAAVGGVVTLEANTAYVISNSITTASRFVMSEGSAIVGYSPISPTLTYSGTGSMFTGVDVNVYFDSVDFNCASGKIFDFSDTVGGVKIFQLKTVRAVSCTTVGNFDSMRTVSFDNFLCFSVATDGIVMAQTVGNSTLMRFEYVSLASTNAGFVGIDLGAAVAGTIWLANNILSGVSGAIGIKGAASSANLTSTGQGFIENCTFAGAMTPVSGINIVTDLQWTSRSNAGIQDTRAGCLSAETATETVAIATINTPVVITGTWTDEGSSRFTPNLTGRITYNGLDPFEAPITVALTAYPASGTFKYFTIYLALNGTVIANSGRLCMANTVDRPSVTVPWQLTFTTGDYIEVFIENNTDAIDFVIDHAVVRIN